MYLPHRPLLHQPPHHPHLRMSRLWVYLQPTWLGSSLHPQFLLRVVCASASFDGFRAECGCKLSLVALCSLLVTGSASALTAGSTRGCNSERGGFLSECCRWSPVRPCKRPAERPFGCLAGCLFGCHPATVGWTSFWNFVKLHSP